MTDRASLTPKEAREMRVRQGNKCARCGRGPPFIAEHSLPVATGNDAKPDCLLCLPCAKLKTYGRKLGLGGDIRDIWHYKRLANAKTQYDKRQQRGPKLKSNAKLVTRGFDKSLRRRLNGKLEKR